MRQLSAILVLILAFAVVPFTAVAQKTILDSGTALVVKDTSSQRSIILPKLTKKGQFKVGKSKLRPKAKSWIDDHYEMIMRTWQKSESCKVLGLQDQIGEFERGLGKDRAMSVLMHMTSKMYPNSEVPMTGFIPTSLVLANDAKTRTGLSKLHRLLNQRAFAFVCEPQKTTVAQVKQFVRAELEEIRKQVEKNQSAIATLQDQAIWWWVLPLVALAVAVGAYFFPRREGNSENRDGDPRRMVPPPPEGPNEPGGEDGPGNREAEAANAPNLTRREREYVEEDDRREFRVVEHFDGANGEDGNR